MVLANQNAKLTGPDQGFLVSRLVLTLKPWEQGCREGYHFVRRPRSAVRGPLFIRPLFIYMTSYKNDMHCAAT